MHPPSETAPVPATPRIVEWAGLHLGWVTTPQVPLAFVHGGIEHAALVLGPPRSGKTSGLVVPSVLMAPAAVVSTSTKADVALATVADRRQVGRCYVFDPTGTTPPVPAAVPLRWSPLTGCRTFEEAVATAHALASAARPAAAMTEAAHWVERAEALLGPLLFAAAAGGRTMADVCRWVLGHDLRDADAALGSLGAPMAKVILSSVARTEDRERSGIFSTAAGILSAYRSDAALAATLSPNFDPHRFAASADTLYICAPAHAQDQLAPLVVALLEQVRTAYYARRARHPDAAPMVFALDEAATIAPVPSLPQIAAEGGGQGLVAMVCLQDLAQARARWGAQADGFFSLFHSKVVLPGIGDRATLELVSALAGDHQVPVRTITKQYVPPPRTEIGRFLTQTPVGSVLSRLVLGPDADPPKPTQSTSWQWRPRLPVADVAGGEPGTALVVQAGRQPYRVQLQNWTASLMKRAAKAES